KEMVKDRLEILIDPFIAKFQGILKTYTLFNFFFISLISAEIIYFFVHLTFLVQTFVMAIHLALIFATVFCYFTLRMYAQTRKTEKLIGLKSEFIQATQELNREPSEESEYHLMISHACCKMAAELHAQEYRI